MGVFQRCVRRHGRALTFVLASVLGMLLVSGAALGAQSERVKGAAPSKISTYRLGKKPIGKLQHAPTNLGRLRSVTRARSAHPAARPATYASTAVTLSPTAAATPAAADLALAPPTPTITSAPSNPSYVTSATFRFSSSGATSFQCRLDSSTFWSTCTSPRTYTSLSAGSHTFRVRARNWSGTSPERVYTWLVSRPPAPVITSGPGSTTLQRTATFAFTSVAPGATFECRLDGGSFSSCSSPRTYTNLSLATHTFRVRARTSLGTGPETVYTWTITPLPAPTIDSGPTAPTTETSATFAFSSPVQGATFQCRFDTSTIWAGCTSPKVYGPLTSGPHTFRVRAIHSTYGTSAEATRTWTILAAPAGKPVKMRILVVSADGNETDLPALQAFLSQIGVPYTTMIATETDLTPEMLSNGETGNYQGVILTTGNLTHNAAAPGEPENWVSAFTPEEWQTLWSYEAEFKVRQVTSFTFPYGLPDDYGLNLQTYQDTLATPLQASLTDAGKNVFSYLNTASPITFKGAWVYLATQRDASVTPLLTTSDGYVIASTNSYPDGRENLAVTAANNPFLLHSQVLSYGLVNWVTRGVFLGERHVNVGVQIDDLFIDSDMWDVDANSDLTGKRFRLSGFDFMNIASWQSGIRSRPNFSQFRMEWAFNGEGTDPATWEGDPILPNGIDTLTPIVRLLDNGFSFVNHTWSHPNLDTTDYATSKDEIERNRQRGIELGLANFDVESLVQPDITGLANPAFQQAAADAGIKNLISDASRPEWANPSPNTGFYSELQPSLFIAPRRANNLFYNLRTPEEWIDEYNWYYWLGSPSSSPWKFWAEPQTLDQILDHESDNLLSYMLRWDVDPWMFHQANLGRYSGSRFLLADLLERTFDKYAQAYNLPVRNITQKASAELMKKRMAYDSSGVDATLTPCQGITLSVDNAATIPLTGVSAGSTETYGGQTISSVPMTPGTTETIPVSC
jgi:hypothetical protein